MAHTLSEERAQDTAVVPTVTLDDVPEIMGWDRKVFPTGWFQVAWSDEIESSAVRPLKYFGKHLVLYRT